MADQNVTGPWPHEDTVSLNAFYGDPRGADGEVSTRWYGENLVQWTPPYQMYYSDGKHSPMNHLKVHRKCYNTFANAFEDALKTLGHDYIVAHHLDVTGGTFCYRLERGGSRLSVHSWGCAIDISPAENPFPRRYGPMDLRFVGIMNKHGFWWRGSKTGQAAEHGTDDDFMHLQLCRH